MKFTFKGQLHTQYYSEKTGRQLAPRMSSMKSPPVMSDTLENALDTWVYLLLKTNNNERLDLMFEGSVIGSDEKTGKIEIQQSVNFFRSRMTKSAI